MTSRRNMIKAGMGLAGIIAAGQAPAVIVRSMLGGYNLSREDDASDPFENPYVKTNLMSMFDGEWNIGLGKHNENSLVWKDLAYKHELTIDKGGSFQSQCLHCDGTARGAYGANVPGDAPVVIEAVIDMSIVTGQFWGIIWHQSAWYSGSYTTRSIVQYNRNGTCLLARYGAAKIREGKVSIHMTYDGLYLTDFRINNISSSFTQDGAPWYPRDGGYYFLFGGSSSSSNQYASPVDIYNFRMYSENLTDDQIAYNHNIDKERFGLQ